MPLDPAFLVAGAIGASFGLLAVLLVRLSSGQPAADTRRRIQLVTGGARRDVPISIAPRDQPAAFARRRAEGSVFGALHLRLFAGKPWYRRLICYLESAGVEATPERLSLVLLAISGGLAMLAKMVLPKLGLVGVVGGVALGPLAMRVALAMMVSRRRKRFLAGFPDALDLMTRGLRSGLPVGEVLAAIARELPEPVAGTFRELDANLRIGLPLSESLDAVAETIDLQEFRFFAISLVLQQETGGNLAEILQNLSLLLRKRNQMQLKIRAMSSEARASAMIIGALPFVTGSAIYVANPEYIGRLFSDPRGWVMLGFATLSMLSGLGIMAKLVRFEV